jgi:hypothetical protein
LSAEVIHILFRNVGIFAYAVALPHFETQLFHWVIFHFDRLWEMSKELDKALKAIKNGDTTITAKGAKQNFSGAHTCILLDVISFLV